MYNFKALFSNYQILQKKMLTNRQLFKKLYLYTEAIWTL